MLYKGNPKKFLPKFSIILPYALSLTMGFVPALRRYYLPSFYGVFGVFTFKFGFEYLVNDVIPASPVPKTLLSIFALVVVLSCLIGGIYHGYDVFLSPRLNRKTLSKLGDLDLVEINPYLDQENGCLSGSYQSFYLNIFPYSDVEKGQGVQINVFFEPEEEKVPDYERLVGTYNLYSNDEEGLCWFTVCVPAHYITGKLDNEKVRSAIHQLIHDLKAAGIKPQVFEN